MSVDHLYYGWFRDDEGTPMVWHECRAIDDGYIIEWKPPPPWEFIEGKGFEPSFNCGQCGAHAFIDQSMERK